MSSAILIQTANREYRPMLTLTRDTHTAYCAHHNFLPRIGFAMNADWRTRLREIYGYLDAPPEPVEWAVYLDADTLIVDQETDLRDACPKDGIGCTWHAMEWGDSGIKDHFHPGALYIHNTPRARELLKQWHDGPSILTAPEGITEIPHRWNSTPPYFAAGAGEVVRGWHGLFNPMDRFQAMRSALLNMQRTGRAIEDPYWQARIRAEMLYRGAKYGVAPPAKEISSVR